MGRLVPLLMTINKCYYIGIICSIGGVGIHKKVGLPLPESSGERLSVA